MSNFFVGLAVFLITVIGSLFAIPYFVDWNSYRGLFEDEASRFLGREVRVSGPVNLHLLPTPSFRLERVRIAEASSNLREPFFRVESLAFKLSIAPLFRGIIEANEIEFRRPVLRLAREARGNWNWQSFGQVFANAAYLPANVAITSLKITEGTLAVHGPGGGERLRLEGIDGELSAPAIDGPYRFRGSFGKGGNEREIRLVTARPDGEAGVRVRTSLRLAETGAIFLLDARLTDLMAEPKLDGELTARLPIGGLARAPPARPLAGAEEDREGAGSQAFDLKAVLRADAAGGTLSDLALSFEQGGRPQLVVGEASARWGDSFEFELDLSSRWLDLDRVAGAGEGARPSESLIPFALRARELLPADGRSRLTLSVDQANLGGEAVSGVRVALARLKDRLDIEQLRVGMPGGSRAELKGALTGPAGAPEFAGSISLRGPSLLRALGWVTKIPAPADGKGDGAFGVSAQLAIGTGRAVVRNILGDISGTPLSGEADWRWQGRPELAVRLEAPQVDVRAFQAVELSLGDALYAVAQGAWSDALAANAALARRADGVEPDLRLSLETGRLITTSHAYRDVAMQVRLKSGNLEVPLLRLADERGLQIDLKGALENVATRPKGSLSGLVAIASAADLGELARVIGVPEGWRPDDRLAQKLAPLRLAGTLAFGTRTATSRDLTLAGDVNGSTVKVSGRLDGGSSGWRSGPAEIVATLDAPDARKLTAIIADGGQGRADKAAPGQAFFKAKGVPADGLSAVLTLAAGDLALDFQGLLNVLEKGNKIAGDLRLKAADGERLAAMAGLAPPLSLAGVGVDGGLRLVAEGGAVNLEQLLMTVGGSEVRGRIGLTRAGERRQVDARLELSELSVRSLLAPLLDLRLAAITGAAEAALAGRQSPWPDEPFDLGALAGIDGHVVLGLRRLGLSDGIGLKDATVDLTLKDGKISTGGIEGGALGGRGRMQFAIESTGTGAAVNGSLQFSDGRLEALTGLGVGAKAGTVGGLKADLTFSGRGANPRNLIAALQGQGRLQSDGKLAGLWPGAIGLATEQVLKNDPERLRAVLREALAQGLSVSRLTLPEDIAVEIGEGQLRTRPIVIDTGAERASGSVAINLSSLLLESEWRLQQVPGKDSALAGKPVLPPVIVSYRGPLAALDKIEPSINSEALERELAVRKMEYDVEALERLRQLDEARRRSEAERLRQEMENPPPQPLPVAPASPARPATPG
jgi:AsmA family/AsmA-like C-terminal region